jgi:SAM-dependent methyltransferase
MTAGPAPACWCGGPLAEPIGPHYRRCATCGSAVRAPKPASAHFDVTDDARDFYGRRYWTEYAVARKLPDIASRARSDLTERCLFWLERMLEVTSPPGRFLEIGCGHGAFVALMRDLGFDAMGTELSPWVAGYGRRTFGIRVEQGPIERLGLDPGFRAVAAFDVLEHLEDPLGTMARAAALLAADGVLAIQTPVYRGEGPDWIMFQEDEHVHLFTEESVRLLLDRAGFNDMRVERSLFPYDMCVAASLSSLPSPSASAVAEGDWSPPTAIRALLDISADVREMRESLRQTAADSEARLAQVDEVTRLLHEAEADRGARLSQVEDLSALLREAETDRAARHDQAQDLSRLLQESEVDRAARLLQIEKLTAWLRESEADRAARGDVIEALKRELNAIEQTWAWRLHTAIASRLNRPEPR